MVNENKIMGFLKKDHKLPPFSSYRQKLLLGLALIILPNLFFWVTAWIMGLARPIINMDYLIPVLLLTAPLPWRLGKIIGIMLFMVAILFDFLMFTMQMFPFLDFAAIQYLLPFLFKAPLRVFVLIGFAITYLLVFPFILNKVSHKTNFGFLLMWTIIFGVFGWANQFQMYYEVQGVRFGRNNYFIAQSQVRLYQSEIQDGFSQLMKKEPTVSPNLKENATRHFKQPFSNKMLLVIAESWGQARRPEVQRSIVQAIYQQQDNLEFIQEGYFDFYGATVQGEMRELCNFNTENGYAFSLLPATTFENCLPNILKKQGYQTIGLHGASSQLYDRNTWYPAVGFNRSLFGENLLDLKTCYAFNGVCDEQMIQVIGNEFKQARHEKVFVYWLSLTAHLPYEVNDIRNNRFDCVRLNVSAGDICNNMRLEAQMFDDLGELIKQPEMKGVEVIVVGDHMPPIFGNVPIHPNLHWNDVPWIHFKVKE